MGNAPTQRCVRRAQVARRSATSAGPSRDVARTAHCWESWKARGAGKVGAIPSTAPAGRRIREQIGGMVLSMPGKKHGGGCRNALGQSAFQGPSPPDASRRQPSGDELLRGADSPTRRFRVWPERPETPRERFAVPTWTLRSGAPSASRHRVAKGFQIAARTGRTHEAPQLFLVVDRLDFVDEVSRNIAKSSFEERDDVVRAVSRAVR